MRSLFKLSQTSVKISPAQEVLYNNSQAYGDAE
eukprot:gene10538-13373_t